MSKNTTGSYKNQNYVENVTGHSEMQMIIKLLTDIKATNAATNNMIITRLNDLEDNLLEKQNTTLVTPLEPNKYLKEDTFAGACHLYLEDNLIFFEQDAACTPALIR
jgi:hypothetical protein